MRLRARIGWGMQLAILISSSTAICVGAGGGQARMSQADGAVLRNLKTRIRQLLASPVRAGFLSGRVVGYSPCTLGGSYPNRTLLAIPVCYLNLCRLVLY